MSIDIELDLKDIHLADRRVEDALNRRFEKDAAMYISNQDVAQIKEWLSSGSFELMYSKYVAESFHPDVFFQTILRNAWLIKSINPEQYMKNIQPILTKLQPEFCKKLLREVAENRVDVPHSFRENLLAYYAKSVGPDEAEQMIMDGHSLGAERLKALVQRVLEQYAGTPQFIVKWNRFLKKYPVLSSDKDILARIHISENRLAEHLQVIVNHLDGTDEDHIYYQNVIASSKLKAFPLILDRTEAAFNLVVKQPNALLKTKMRPKLRLWLKQLYPNVDRIYGDEKLKEERPRIFGCLTHLYNKFPAESGEMIRYFFKRIKNPDLHQQIIAFLKTKKIPPNYVEDVRELQFGEKNKEFNDVGGLFRALASPVKADAPRLYYLAVTFTRLPNLDRQMNELFRQLDLKNANHNQFLIQLLLKKSDSLIWQKTLEYAVRSRDMDLIVQEVVSRSVPRDTHVKAYMHKRHFMQYSQLYGV